jgi:hypothetical protein
MGQSLPVPKRPGASKQAAFSQEEKVRASVTRNRPEFEKHLDDPETGEWKQTRSYLISISYFAFKAGCSEDEVLWYLVEFIRQHAPQFWLTPKRLKTILNCSKGRRKSALRKAATNKHRRSGPRAAGKEAEKNTQRQR